MPFFHFYHGIHVKIYQINHKSMIIQSRVWLIDRERSNSTFMHAFAPFRPAFFVFNFNLGFFFVSLIICKWFRMLIDNQGRKSPSLVRDAFDRHTHNRIRFIIAAICCNFLVYHSLACGFFPIFALHLKIE